MVCSSYSIPNPAASPELCRVCGGSVSYVFEKDLNVSCGDYFEGRRIYARSEETVRLAECIVCGFAAFYDMHRWTSDRFSRDIYNVDYHLCDPVFKEVRPRKLFNWLTALMAPVDLLDYGAGEGALVAMLKGAGFDATAFDPYFGEQELPNNHFSIVTAFEVVEHACDQASLFRDLSQLCAPEGTVVVSTLLKPGRLCSDWWYASPRNGHVSFHTIESLRIMASRVGMKIASLSQEIHVLSYSDDVLIRRNRWPTIDVNDKPSFYYDRPWTHLSQKPCGIGAQ